MTTADTYLRAAEACQRAAELLDEVLKMFPPEMRDDMASPHYDDFGPVGTAYSAAREAAVIFAGRATEVPAAEQED